MNDIGKFKKFTILYVEDNEQIREHTTYILKKMFKEVYEATNGEEGLKFYEKHHPHIILTDIYMPELGGMDMVKIIRKEDRKTKIIVATAYTDKEYLLDAIELDVVSYIEKPLNVSVLLKAFEKSFSQMKEDEPTLIEIGDGISFDLSKRLLFKNGKIVKITKKELLILEILLNNKDRVVAYEEIHSYVWKGAYMSSDTLRSTVRFLRKKLPDNSLENVSGVGYKIFTKG